MHIRQAIAFRDLLTFLFKIMAVFSKVLKNLSASSGPDSVLLEETLSDPEDAERFFSENEGHHKIKDNQFDFCEKKTKNSEL